MRKCKIIDRLALTKHGVIRVVNDGQEMGKAPPETLRGEICPECGNHSLFPEGGCWNCKSCGYSKCDLKRG